MGGEQGRLWWEQGGLWWEQGRLWWEQGRLSAGVRNTQRGRTEDSARGPWKTLVGARKIQRGGLGINVRPEMKLTTGVIIGPISESDFFTWEVSTTPFFLVDSRVTHDSDILQALICGPKDTPFVSRPASCRGSSDDEANKCLFAYLQEGGIFCAKLTFVSTLPHHRSPRSPEHLLSPLQVYT